MTFISRKSPQVVKHVVKCEKRACSTLEAGKNKPVMFIAETRDFARICEEIEEKSGLLRIPILVGVTRLELAASTTPRAT